MLGAVVTGLMVGVVVVGEVVVGERVLGFIVSIVGVVVGLVVEVGQAVEVYSSIVDRRISRTISGISFSANWGIALPFIMDPTAILPSA